MPGAYESNSTHSTLYDKDVYFASLPIKECVSAIIDRCDTYTNEMLRTGRHSLYKNAHIHMMQGYASRGFISNTGALGELSSTFVNHYRNLIEHAVNLVCQERLDWEPQMDGQGWDAMDQVKKARNILEHYESRTDLDIDGKLRKGVEEMAVFGDAWITVLWDKFAGDEVGSVNGVTVKEGDVEIRVWNPFDVFIDVAAQDISQCQWVVIREVVNKFDLIAKYPMFASQLKSEIETFNSYKKELVSYSGDVVDLIYAWRFLHMKTPACPEGKEVYFVTDEIVLENKALEYRKFPAIRLAASDCWGTPFGYSKFYDLLPGQDAVDRLTSCVLTNQLTFGTQNILMPLDAHINHTTLYGGLHVIGYDASKGNGAKPEALNLTSTPPEIFNNIDKTVQSMGTLAGINDAVKGDPNIMIKGQASGAALALLTTNAINFNSDIQKVWVNTAEKIGELIITELADNVAISRTATAKSGIKTYPFNFVGDDVNGITKVKVKIGNPLLQTDAGRLQVAETLIQSGSGVTKEDVIGIIVDGDFSSITEDVENELMLIEDENEHMMQGEMIPDPIIFENHQLHIKKHKPKLMSLDAKKNPNVVKAFTAHVQKHIDLLVGSATAGPMNPVLAGLLGQPIVPPNTTPPTLISPKLQSAPMPNPQPGGQRAPAAPIQNKATPQPISLPSPKPPLGAH